MLPLTENSKDAQQAVLAWSRHVFVAQGESADFSIETTDMHDEGWNLVFTVTAGGETFTGRFPILSMMDKRHYGTRLIDVAETSPPGPPRTLFRFRHLPASDGF